MLAVAVFDETDEMTACEGCGQPVEVDDDNYFSSIQNGCGHISGDSGYYCDECWPYCSCSESTLKD